MKKWRAQRKGNETLTKLHLLLGKTKSEKSFVAN